MNDRITFPRVAFLFLAVAALAAFSRPAWAGTYADIMVQGEAAGTEFNDWVGIPVLANDPIDNPGGSPEFIDIEAVQVANDDQFLYIRIAYHNNSSANTYVAIDTDQNKATGFDVAQVGLIGSEIGYQNDFPFSQMTGIFNTNVALTGGPIGNGGALIWPYWDQDGPDKEMAIPRNLFVTFPAGPAFTQNSIDIMIYTDEGLYDITDVISYTFADAPAGTPGDYNGDTHVDAADYTIWRDTLGSTADLRANGNDTGASAGVIDAADYDVWKTGFGSAGSGSLAAAGVPEPASVVMAIVALVAVGGLRRRSS